MLLQILGKEWLRQPGNMKVQLYKGDNGANIMKIDDVVWMSDEPEEREIQKKLAEKSRGKVLCAGLGYGLYQTEALKNPKVESIRTIELHKEMAKICEKFSPELLKNKKHECILKDFYKYETKDKFDTVYGDIWTDEDSFRDEKVWEDFKEYAKRFLAEGGQIIGWSKYSL